MFVDITWTADPTIFTLFGREIRWYGLFFAIGFLVGYKMIEYMFKKEQVPPVWADKLFIYVIVATVIGSRLGHCLFYEPEIYLKNPVEIFKIWKGGLASHGGTIGNIIGVWLYSRNITKRSMLWTFDRLVIPTALVAALIRLGNLMNSEIYGHPTTVSWGFNFVRSIDWHKAPINGLPCHPTQIYEAFFYIVTFLICIWLYWKKEAYKKQGLIFGVFLICIFASRFFIEFLKNNQVDFEQGMLLNMGQLLSIPFVIAGFVFIYLALTKKTPVNTSKKIVEVKKKDKSPK